MFLSYAWDHCKSVLTYYPPFSSSLSLFLSLYSQRDDTRTFDSRATSMITCMYPAHAFPISLT